MKIETEPGKFLCYQCPARLVTSLDDKDIGPGSRQIRRSCQAIMASPDHDYVEFLVCSHLACAPLCRLPFFQYASFLLHVIDGESLGDPLSSPEFRSSFECR